MSETLAMVVLIILTIMTHIGLYYNTKIFLYYRDVEIEKCKIGEEVYGPYRDESNYPLAIAFIIAIIVFGWGVSGRIPAGEIMNHLDVYSVSVVVGYIVVMYYLALYVLVSRKLDYAVFYRKFARLDFTGESPNEKYIKSLKTEQRVYLGILTVGIIYMIQLWSKYVDVLREQLSDLGLLVLYYYPFGIIVVACFIAFVGLSAITCLRQRGWGPDDIEKRFNSTFLKFLFTDDDK